MLVWVAVIVSLAANVVLWRVRVRAEARERAHAATVAEGAALAREDKAGHGVEIARALNAGDAVKLREQLRAAGADEEGVAFLVAAAIRQGYEARLKQARGGERARRWWIYERYEDALTREQYQAVKRLEAEMKARIVAVLGRDPQDEIPSGWADTHLAGVPREKHAALREVEEDYNQMFKQLARDMKSLTLPEDVEKARLLQEEKRRDLRALLTPEEYAEYEARNSGTARNVRFRLDEMNPTEAEYRAVFELQREFDDRYAVYGELENTVTDWATLTPEQREERQRAEAEVNKRIRETLGEERYRDYVLAGDHSFGQLRTLTERLGLPANTAEQIYGLRDTVPQEALKVADNTSLSVEEKRAALSKLAAEAKAQVVAALGPVAAEAYLGKQYGGMTWLKELEAGVVNTFDAEGRQSRARELPAK